MDLLFLGVGGLCVLLTGISKSGFAGGLGVLAVPAMSLFVTPQDAAAIMLPILCLIDLASVWKYRKDWIAKYVLLLLPGALVGLAIGAFSFSYLNAAFMKLLIGLFALSFAVHYFLGRSRANKTKPLQAAKVVGFGAFSGLSSFVAHAGGPPIKAVLLSQNLEKSKMVGTNSVFFFLMNQIKIVPYFFLGQFTHTNLEMSAYLLPFVPVGVFLGFFLHNRVSQSTFTTVAYAFLTLSGLKLTWDAMRLFLA